MKLSEKVAIITGSSKGIGKAMAYAMAKAGATVVISSRKPEAVDEVVRAFEAEGLSAIGIPCNVGQREEVHHLVERTVEQCGGIDVLVNNAGTNPVFGSTLELEDWAFEKIMAVNFNGPYELSRAVFPHMRERGGGSIINVSSVEGLTPNPGLGMYSISKAALIMLTKVHAQEFGAAGIRVNALCPGLVKTKLSQAVVENPQLMKRVMSKQALSIQGQPEDMAGLGCFLAGDEARFITGAVMVADGGLTI